MTVVWKAHTAIARLGGLQKEGVKVDFSKVIKMIDDMVTSCVRVT